MFAFFPTCNFRLLAVTTKQVFVGCQAWSWKNNAHVLLVRVELLTGKRRKPTGGPERIFLIIFCLISLPLTALLVQYPSTHGDNMHSSISTSLGQLDLARFSVGWDVPVHRLCLSWLARFHCVYSIHQSSFTHDTSDKAKECWYWW